MEHSMNIDCRLHLVFSSNGPSLVRLAIGLGMWAPITLFMACSVTSPARHLPSRLTESDITNVLRQNQPSIEACIDRALPDEEGTLQVEMMIQPSGHPMHIRISPWWQGTEIESCVVHAIRKWQFPAFHGPSMTVDFPFVVRARLTEAKDQPHCRTVCAQYRPLLQGAAAGTTVDRGKGQNSVDGGPRWAAHRCARL